MSANSLTATMVRQPKATTLITTLLKLPDSWPDPLESIDLTVPESVIRERITFVEHYFWAIKGRALAAYSSIQDKIKDCLSCRDDLFEGETESALPSSIDCYMVGRKKEKSRPCITVSCQSKIYCHKAINVIKESDWWICFSKEFPGFKFIHLRNRPRPIRMANLGDGDIFVYTSQLDQHGYGAPLFFFPSESPTYTTTRHPDSTLGGIVHLDGEPYGLTVAHAVRKQEHEIIDDSDLADDCDAFSTFSFMDDSDDDYESDSDRSTETPENDSSSTNDLSEQQPLARMPIANAEVQTTVPLSLKRVGKVILSSGGSASDEVDWALIELDQEWKEYHNVNGKVPDVGSTITTKHGGHNQGVGVLKVVPELPLLDQAKPVYSFDCVTHEFNGVLKTNQTLVRLKGSQAFLSLYNIQLMENMHVGDCGTWIIDSDDNWYGHIVAGNSLSRVAYVAPGYKIQRAIEMSTTKQLTFMKMIAPSSSHVQILNDELESFDRTEDVQSHEVNARARSAQSSNTVRKSDEKISRPQSLFDSHLSTDQVIPAKGNAYSEEDITKQDLTNNPTSPMPDTSDDHIFKSTGEDLVVEDLKKPPQTPMNTQSNNSAAISDTLVRTVVASGSTDTAVKQDIPGCYPCEKCDWTYFDPQLYAEHILEHANQIPCECLFPDCNENFYTHGDLKNHLHMNHDIQWPVGDERHAFVANRRVSGVQASQKKLRRSLSTGDAKSRARETSLEPLQNAGSDLYTAALHIPGNTVQNPDYLPLSSPPMFSKTPRPRRIRQPRQQIQVPEIPNAEKSSLVPVMPVPDAPIPVVPLSFPDETYQTLYHSPGGCVECRQRHIACDSAMNHIRPCSSCFRLNLLCVPATGDSNRGGFVYQANLEPLPEVGIGLTYQEPRPNSYYPPSSYRGPAQLWPSDVPVARKSASDIMDPTIVQVASSRQGERSTPRKPTSYSVGTTTTQVARVATQTTPHLPLPPALLSQIEAEEEEEYQRRRKEAANKLTIEALRHLNVRNTGRSSTSSGHSSSSRSERSSIFSYQSSSRDSSTTTSSMLPGSGTMNITLANGLTIAVPSNSNVEVGRNFTINIGGVAVSKEGDDSKQQSNRSVTAAQASPQRRERQPYRLRHVSMNRPSSKISSVAAAKSNKVGADPGADQQGNSKQASPDYL